jgi:polyhydroxyalkanoate synthesis regulator phasin
MKAHEAFDKLWKTGKMDRQEAYRRLARELGKEVEKTHIGWMYEAEARRVTEIVRSGALLIP